MNYYRYTDDELKSMLSKMVILTDTREQKNQHIIKTLDELGIAHHNKTLATGDYSVMLPAFPELGIPRPMFFDRTIAIERKGSLEELSGNFTKERERLKDELTRARDMQFFLVIEDASYQDILEHRYTTKLSEKSFFASLLAFQQQFNLNVNFIDKAHAGLLVYSILYYFVRGKLLAL